MGFSKPVLVLWGRSAIVFCNQASLAFLGPGERSKGGSHTELLGRPVRSSYAETTGTYRALLGQVLTTVNSTDGWAELGWSFRDVTRASVERSSFELECIPIRDLEGGLRGTFVVWQERRTDEPATSQQLLACMTDSLRPLADPIEIQGTAAQLLGSHLNVTRVMYGEVEADDEHIRFDRGYAEAGAPNLLGRFRMRDFGEHLVTALFAGQTIVIDEVAVSQELTPRERSAYSGLGIAALVGVPLVKQGRLVANISVHAARARRWSQEEVSLIQETAERTWAAVQRARAEAALRQRDEEYRLLFEAMEEGYALCEIVRDEAGQTKDIRYLELNRAFENLLGLPRGRFVGRLRSELLRDPMKETLLRYSHAVETSRPTRFEKYIEALDRWFDVRVHPRADDRFAMIYDDITTRKKAEQTLLDDDARKTCLLAFSDRVRAAAGPLDIHAIATELLRDYFGASCFSVIYDDEAGFALVLTEMLVGDVPSLKGQYALVDFPLPSSRLREGMPLVESSRSFSTIPLDKQGVQFRAANVTVPIVRSGRLLASLTVLDPRPRDWTEHDVDLVQQVSERLWIAVERGRTEAAHRESERLARRLLEQATAARAQVEAANRSKDEFLATLSHELRTPLAAIQLWAGALRSGAVPSKDMPRALESITQSADSQSRLIEDLLDLSRLTSGKLALSRAPHDVRRLGEAAMEMIEPIALEKSIALTIRISDEVTLAVLDGARIKQVLWNLLTNALKFTPRGGSVSLRISATDAVLEFEVKDTGEGIPPESVPRVFDKFWQADMGPTRAHLGLGIGLALAKQLVELHGGRITAQSDGRGMGATFRVELPLIQDDSSVANEAESELHGRGFGAAAPLESVRVLLVEDDSSTQAAMQRVLEHAGARVTAVVTAKEGLHALDSEPIDVII
ncbi:MAG TPA: ATP-binding protein, partial [Polyangiaceae bacterium]|nr:ATP-binding protein [Polyangiaceae bacterium]